MRRRLISIARQLECDCLRRPEDQHANARSQEELSPPDTLDQERSAQRNRKVPNLQDTVDQKLRGRARDADGVENPVEVVGDETVSGPLREEGNGDDDAQTLAVSG